MQPGLHTYSSAFDCVVDGGPVEGGDGEEDGEQEPDGVVHVTPPPTVGVNRAR